MLFYERKHFSSEPLSFFTAQLPLPPLGFCLPTDQDLCVSIAATKNNLSEGDTLWLSCTLEAQRSDSRHFQVAWVLNSTEVARIDPHGLLIWKKEYEERASLGQLHAFKQSNAIYILTIREVGLEDSGAYHCSVLEVKAPGSLQSIQTNLSSVLRISVKPIGEKILMVLLGETYRDAWLRNALSLALPWQAQLSFCCCKNTSVPLFSDDNGKSICSDKYQHDGGSSSQNEAYIFSLVLCNQFRTRR